MKKNIFSIPVQQERIQPEDLKDVTDLMKGNIKKINYVPPIIGDGTFGSFDVTYKHPVFKHVAK